MQRFQLQKFNHAMNARPTIIGLFACFRSDADTTFQTQAREWICAVKECKGFGCSFGRIRVVLSQHLASLRTKKLHSLLHGLLQDLVRNNEVPHEAAIE